MDFFRFLLCVILGFLLSGVWLGLCFIIGVLIQKLKIPWLSYFDKLLASLIPIIFIASTVGIYPIQISRIQNISVYIIAIVTIVITTAIITRKKSIKHKKGKDMLLWGVDGLLMEILQRLMMQSFVYGMLKLLGVSQLTIYNFIASSFIWILGYSMHIFLFNYVLV